MNQEKSKNKETEKDQLRLIIKGLKEELRACNETLRLHPGEMSEMTRQRRDGIQDQLVVRERELEALDGK